MTRITARVVALALLLAACGGSDEPVDAASPSVVEVTSVENEPTPATADEPDPAEEPEVAEAEPVEELGDPTPTPESDAAPEPTSAAPVGASAGGFSLNGFRYCEILIVVDGDDGAPVTEVWGTPGVDPCTDEAWYALDPAALMAENGASDIDMNGPRYFTVDAAIDTAPAGGGGVGTAAGGEAVNRSFGDITMNLLATVDGPAIDSSTYEPSLVVRTTTWAFNAGTEIYELVDPEGTSYVMQSYSLIVDPELAITDLAGLGDRLDLPEGWSFVVRTLDEPLQLALSPDGAMVLQDDLRNSYQRNG